MIAGVGLLLLGLGAAAGGQADVTAGRLDALARARLIAGVQAEHASQGRVRFATLPGLVVAPRAGAAVAIGCAVLVGLGAGPIPGVLIAVVTYLGARAVRNVLAARDFRRGHDDLAAAIASMSDEVAAGAGLATAFAAAAPLAGRYRSDFTDAATLLSADVDLAVSWRTPPELGGLAVASALSARTGSAVSAVLEAVGRDLEADRTISAAVRTALAGPRSAGVLLAALPLVGIGLGSAMGGRPLDVLLHSTVGLVCLVVGAVLDLAGVGWIGVLVRRVTP